MISFWAGRPFLANSACCRPLQIVASALLTVTIIGYESTRFGTTFAFLCTRRMASRAALYSCCPPSQLRQYVTTYVSLSTGDPASAGVSSVPNQPMMRATGCGGVRLVCERQTRDDRREPAAESRSAEQSQTSAKPIEMTN